MENNLQKEKEIAEKILLELRRQKTTMTELGERLGFTRADISQTITRLEEGKGITVGKLEKIAKALNISFQIGV